jgi:hypothetical protein
MRFLLMSNVKIVACAVANKHSLLPTNAVRVLLTILSLLSLVVHLGILGSVEPLLCSSVLLFVAASTHTVDAAPHVFATSATHIGRRSGSPPKAPPWRQKTTVTTQFSSEVPVMVLENDRGEAASQCGEVDQQINALLDQLSPDELESAARASYAYEVAFPVTTITPLTLLDCPVRARHRRLYASCLAHQAARQISLFSASGQRKALQILQNTIQFRRTYNVDHLRHLFRPSTQCSSTQLSCTCQQTLDQHLQSRDLYVCGYDRQGRATYIFKPTEETCVYDGVWTVKKHIYTLERALACSRHPGEINAVVHFSQLSPGCLPPMHLAREFLRIFRNHYATTVHKVFVVDAPPILAHVLWHGMLQPFLPRDLRKKIVLVRSSADASALADFYDAAEAASWMMPHGTKNRDLNIEEYLYQTEFHQAFNE